MENTPLSSMKVNDKLFQKLQKAVAESGLSVTDVRRHALSLGLDALKRMNYDVEGFLSASVAKLMETPPLESLPDSAKERKSRKA